MENIINGIYIGLVGTVVLFTSLGLLSLIIRLVNQLFQPETAVPAPITPEATATATAAASNPELAAAVAVGVAYLLAAQNKQADLGHLLEQTPSHWRYSPASASQIARKE